LQKEIAKLRETNEQFLNERLHTSLQLAIHMTGPIFCTKRRVSVTPC